MTLHFSHIFLTDALTFIGKLPKRGYTTRLENKNSAKKGCQRAATKRLVAVSGPAAASFTANQAVCLAKWAQRLPFGPRFV